MYKLVYKGKFHSLNRFSNMSRANKYAGSSYKNKAEKDIKEQFLLQVSNQGVKTFEEEVYLKIIWHEASAKNKQRRDLDNITYATKFLLDAMVDLNIFYDDSRKYIKQIDHKIVISDEFKIEVFIFTKDEYEKDIIDVQLDKKISFVIEGRLPSYNQYINAERTHYHKGGRFKKKYTNKVEIAIFEELGITNKIDNYPVLVDIKWYEKDLRRDSDNITFSLKFILDALVNRGIIKDDSLEYVSDIKNTVLLDRENPRIEVSIIPLKLASKKDTVSKKEKEFKTKDGRVIKYPY